jgi:hypothetical protein
MRVVCRHCGKLVDEKLAIKITVADYEECKMMLDDLPMISIPPNARNEYTQICEMCWKNLRWLRR